jgi:hypothetical protein
MMNFKMIFGPALIIFGGIFEVADFVAWSQFYRVSDSKFSTGLVLTFILVAGIGAITGGVHLYHEAQAEKKQNKETHQ